MAATLETNLMCEKGGQWQPVLALLSEAVPTLETNLMCDNGGQ